MIQNPALLEQLQQAARFFAEIAGFDYGERIKRYRQSHVLGPVMLLLVALVTASRSSKT
jgi:hypothetical protein